MTPFSLIDHPQSREANLSKVRYNSQKDACTADVKQPNLFPEPFIFFPSGGNSGRQAAWERRGKSGTRSRERANMNEERRRASAAAAAMVKAAAGRPSRKAARRFRGFVRERARSPWHARLQSLPLLSFLPSFLSSSTPRPLLLLPLLPQLSFSLHAYEEGGRERERERGRRLLRCHSCWNKTRCPLAL